MVGVLLVSKDPLCLFRWVRRTPAETPSRVGPMPFLHHPSTANRYGSGELKAVRDLTESVLAAKRIPFITKPAVGIFGWSLSKFSNPID